VAVPGSVSLEISYNRQDFTSHGVQFMYDAELQIAAVTPGWGPVSGHTPVRVVGQNFKNHPSDQLKCRFGDQEVPAVWHSGREMGCSSPRLGDIDEIQTVTTSSLAHMPEVQTITTSLVPYVQEVHNLTIEGPEVTSEVQVIKTVATDRDEVQVVETGADLGSPRYLTFETAVETSKPEIQTITTTTNLVYEEQAISLRSFQGDSWSANGVNSVADVQAVTVTGTTGSFELTLGVDTVTVAMTASGPILRQQLINTFTTVDDCEVTKTSSAASKSWTVTFLDGMGHRPLMTAALPSTGSGDITAASVQKLTVGSVQEWTSRPGIWP
jgi:hypothetical protein